MDLGKETGLEWFSGGDIQYILFKPYSDWHYFCPSLQVCWLSIIFQICNLKDFECVLITVFSFQIQDTVEVPLRHIHYKHLTN